MRKTMILLIAAMLVAAAAWAESLDNSYIQRFELEDGGGRIDWQNGFVTATGVGMAPPGARGEAQARALAVRAATVTARRNLLEIIGGVQIDSSTTIRNNMVANDSVQSVINGYLHNSRILDTAYMSDGSVVVTVSLNQHGPISDAVLPKGPAFKTGLDPIVQVPEGAPAEGPFTGLVIDARGLGARPALSPQIKSPEGKTVYGREYVSRDFAVSQGMAGYAADLASASGNARVGDNPMVVKALEVSGKARTDLVVDSVTANRILSLAARTGVLEQCRVMIVLDGGENKE